MLLMFGRHVQKEASRLYPLYVSLDVRMSCPNGSVSWAGIVQAYTQYYVTDLVQTEAANRVKQTRHKQEEDEKTN